MNTQNDDRKVIPIESHPWWGKKHEIRLPKRSGDGTSQFWCVGVGWVTAVEAPNPEPPTAA